MRNHYRRNTYREIKRFLLPGEWLQFNALRIFSAISRPSTGFTDGTAKQILRRPFVPPAPYHRQSSEMPCKHA